MEKALQEILDAAELKSIREALDTTALLDKLEQIREIAQKALEGNQ